MRWFKVWGSGLQTNPKWLALSLEERGAWITLMTIASALEPAWRFQSAEHAGMLLGREGADNAGALLDRLIEMRLFDLMDDDAVVVHDYSQWQKYPSDAPEATRERQRRSRAARAPFPIEEVRVTARHDSVTTSHDPDEHQATERQTESETEDEDFRSRLLIAGLDPDLARGIAPIKGG